MKRTRLFPFVPLAALALVFLGCDGGTRYIIYESEAGDEDATSTGNRVLVVAGCVPQQLPSTGIVGSVWVFCNDLEFADEDIEQTELESCTHLVDNGVVAGLEIRELRNRRWQQFRLLCGEMGDDGVVAANWTESPLLFDFGAEGELFRTAADDGRIPMGIMEVFNRLQLRESLLSIGLNHLPADSIFDAGVVGAWSRNHRISPRIPDSSPQLIGTTDWLCPPGKALTGAAVGHIPLASGDATRPVYILAECRTLTQALTRS